MFTQRDAGRPEKTPAWEEIWVGAKARSLPSSNGRIEHKMTKQTIYIPRDCVTLGKSFVVYCTYLFLEAGCRQPACLSMILSLSSRQPGLEAAPDFMLWPMETKVINVWNKLTKKLLKFVTYRRIWHTFTWMKVPLRFRLSNSSNQRQILILTS